MDRLRFLWQRLRQQLWWRPAVWSAAAVLAALASALAMIFGGAVGNLIDRLRFGEVVDFLDVYLGAYHWPAFNVADSAITVGITIFIAHVVLGKMPD